MIRGGPLTITRSPGLMLRVESRRPRTSPTPSS